MKNVIRQILRAVMVITVESVCVYFGWNVLFVRVFEAVPHLSFLKVILLTISLSFIFIPVTYGVTKTIKDNLKELLCE